MISLKSQVTIRILNYFFLNPEASHYVNEFARILKVDPKNLLRKLNELEKEGILKSTFIGKQRHFSLNQDSKITKTYQELLIQTVGLKAQLKEVIKKVRGVEQAYIYGSYAKDAMSSGSDIDVLVVGNHSALELQKAINQVQEWIGREINVVNLNERELNQKKRKKNPFIGNIFSNKYIKLL